MSLPERRTAHLRWGRVSRPGATYFVTVCTKDRERVFANDALAKKTVATLSLIHEAGDAEILAATVMPDHVHLHFTLGLRLRLGQVIGKFKSIARNHGKASWQWQEDGFEHELRQNESIEDYALYVFMNPYRAGLIELSQKWDYWFCPDPKRFLFLSLFSAVEPVPAAWLEKSISLRARLARTR
jgi:putative transposase